MLTDKQKLFCKEYLVDLNATQAAIRAGYSTKTAAVIATENLRKPNIQAEIQKGMDKRAEKAELNAEYVLKGIQGIVDRSVDEDTYDPKSALKGYELLGKHLKLFTDVQEQKHSFNKMGRVVVGVGKDDEGKEEIKTLTFDVGRDPDEDISDE